MSHFIYHILYRPGFKMGKPDDLSRGSEEEKSGMDAYFFDEGQLVKLENHDVGEEKDAEDVKLVGIDVATWEKKNRLCVVTQENRLEVPQQHHVSQVAGHWGIYRTQEQVSGNFIWDQWTEDVAIYVAGCVKCQKSKAGRYSKSTKLVPILTRERPLEEIAMDFDRELPESEGFHPILVVTDRFTKVQHYILAKTIWTAEDLANSYINNIWKLYGLPRDRPLDHGMQFTLRLLKELN